MNPDEIKKIARSTIEIESKAAQNLIHYINDDFVECINLIANCSGKVVITGIGKSAVISQKIVATLNSTGTPAIFMHAADAIHGDLGSIQKDDVIICISKSGSTPEISLLVPLIKNMGNKLISMVSNLDSILAKQADYVLHTPIEKEACPFNLAPTSSTTVQLIMGDAIAICLLNFRGFSTNDFAKFHPGGSLGKKLYLRVSDLYINNSKPKVLPGTNVKSVILTISENRLGATAVINENDEIIGIITDGDLRRMIEKYDNFDKVKAIDIMSKSPVTTDTDMLAINAFHLMKQNNITQILVTNENKYVGIVHIHDILKEGIV